MSAEPLPDVDFDLTYNAATWLAMKGLKLIRLRPGSKIPYDNKWPELATNDPATIDEWFGGDSPYNLGLACGMQPNGLNVVAIDIDPKNGGVETWGALTAKYGKVGGPRHTTPSGGYHLPLIFPEGFRNSRNMLGPGIDTRGEGGQIVLPPSVLINHETGEIIGRYARALGLGVLMLDMIEAPEWLVEHLSAPPAPLARQQSVARTATTESPLDYLRRTLDPVDVIVNRYHWQIHSVRGDDTFVTRPGKAVRDGVSAVIHRDGAIVVFTTTDVQHLVQRPTSDGTGIKMSLAEFIAAEETGGDLSELSRRVKEHMPPPLTSGRGGITDGSEAEASADALGGGSWFTPVDLTSYFDGTHVDVEPTVLRRNDGVAMFYPGVVNGIHGESGLGKGWVVLAAVVEVVRDGGHAIYIDLEDTPQSITSRLRTLGITKAEADGHITYVRPTDPTDDREIEGLRLLCEQTGADLVIIDSLGEAFGLDGINENNDNEVTPWIRKVGRKLADTGACIVVVDHVTKAMDNPLYAKGTARKRAALGGSSFLVEALQPMTKDVGGKLRLTCAKDRNTAHTRGQVSAEIVFKPYGDGLRASVFRPVDANDSLLGEQEKYDNKIVDMATAMLKIAKRKRLPFTMTALRSETHGSSNTIKGAAFNYLVERQLLLPEGKGTYKVSPLA